MSTRNQQKSHLSSTYDPHLIIRSLNHGQTLMSPLSCSLLTIETRERTKCREIQMSYGNRLRLQDWAMDLSKMAKDIENDFRLNYTPNLMPFLE